MVERSAVDVVGGGYVPAMKNHQPRPRGPQRSFSLEKKTFIKRKVSGNSNLGGGIFLLFFYKLTSNVFSLTTKTLNQKNQMYEMQGTRYIFVLGSVISGLGKGVVSASISKILISKGYKTTNIKIDPYINIDAGTLRPTEHGEVFVTDDGGEIDEDFGHYERFTGNSLPKINNITTGQIYRRVIENERRGRYLGKTVQLIPHITDEVIRRIKTSAEGKDFAIVEVGGSIGDYEILPFLSAISILEEPKAIVLLGYLPLPKHLGEMKTKPTQHAVMLARSYGIIPDFLLCRSEKKLDEIRRKKLSVFTGISEDNILSVEDCGCIYEVPLILESQNFSEKILKKFSLVPKYSDLSKWKELVDNMKNSKKQVFVNIVGKYVKTGAFSLPDSYVSIIEAVNHAAANLGVRAKIKVVDSTKFESNDLKGGIIVPGGFGSSGVEGKIKAITHARENNVPFLGLCFGMQLAVVEFARNMCGLGEAHSTEINPQTPHPVICILDEQKEILDKENYGGTMRLGSYVSVLKKGSIVEKLYGKETIYERHRHRYEVNPEYFDILEKNGMLISGKSPDGKLAEFIELKNHVFFVGTQAHPEFKSRFENPHPLFTGFIKALLGK